MQIVLYYTYKYCRSNIYVVLCIFMYQQGLSKFIFSIQTITGAMSTLTPPISLEKPENQARVDYIQDVASGIY